MGLYAVKRLGAVLVILVIMSILVFLATHALPANTAAMILGQYSTPETQKALEHKLGLDLPLAVQYWSWASLVLQGDLGQSLVMERPVAPIIADALGASAVLAACSFVFVATIGIALGVVAAVRRNKALDHGISIFTYVGISVPEFFWGIVLVIVFARYLGWLPPGGRGDASDDLLTRISYLVLPTATLTFTLIAHVSRMTRSSMIETLRTQYVRNARAKGLPERVVILRHALRNALLPTITVLAVDIGWLIGGIVVVETVFSYPGLGRMMIFALERHDLPLIQGSILVITAIYCSANLLADLLYAFVNPKIRYGNAVR